MKWIILAAIAIIWVIAMWIAVVYVMWRGWGPYIRSKRQPKTRVRARIANKQGRHEFNPVDWQPELTQKVLVFECDDGVIRDYEVPDAAFDFVDIGDDGDLVYQGELFVRFESRRPTHDLDKEYKRLTRS